MPHFQIDHDLPPDIPCIVLETSAGRIAFVSAAYLHRCAAADNFEEASAVVNATLDLQSRSPLRLVG